jgi:hypothetical protein
VVAVDHVVDWDADVLEWEADVVVEFGHDGWHFPFKAVPYPHQCESEVVEEVEAEVVVVVTTVLVEVVWLEEEVVVEVVVVLGGGLHLPSRAVPKPQ